MSLAPTSEVHSKYSRGSNIEQVRYSDGPWPFGFRMVGHFLFFASLGRFIFKNIFFKKYKMTWASHSSVFKWFGPFENGTKWLPKWLPKWLENQT